MRRLLPTMLLIACGAADGLPAEVTYEAHVAPILDRHCVRCHSEAGSLYAGVGVDEYRNARSSRIRSVCTAVSAEVVATYGDTLASASQPELGPCADWAVGSMPPGAKLRLSGQEQELLARWVAQGAQP